MTPAEIIARAYDREQAAQMGEPDPWQDGTDDPQWQDSLGCGEAAVEALTAAGSRILGQGELDRETLEKAAEMAERGVEYGATTRDLHWLLRSLMEQPNAR